MRRADSSQMPNALTRLPQNVTKGYSAVEVKVRNGTGALS